MTDQTGQQEALEPGMPGAAGQESGAPVQDTGAAGAIAVEDVTSREELEQLYEESLKHIQEGEIVRGRVVHIGRDSVLVDVGYKSEGIIDLDEFPDQGRHLQVGEEVDVLLKKRRIAKARSSSPRRRRTASKSGTISVKSTITMMSSMGWSWRVLRVA